MNSKMTRVIASFCSIVGAIVLLCLMLIISGAVTPSISGFAIDSSGKLYVGMPQKICIYDAETLVGSISPYTSRSYAFTINEDDNIILSTSTKVYLMNLDGTILDTWDDPGADTFNQIRYRKAEYISANGDVYKLSSVFGWISITKNGVDVVWHIDLFSYIVILLLGISATAILGLFVWISYVQKRSRDV